MAVMLAPLLPLLAALAVWLPPLRRAAWPVSMAACAGSLAASLAVAATVLRHGVAAGPVSLLAADGFSALVLLVVSFVCLGACVFAGGYLRERERHRERLWWFFCAYDLFAFALLVAPVLTDPNLAWVGVELVTLFGVLLVGYESTPGALEAAWKFAMLTIVGAPIALLGFFVLFWAWHLASPGQPETWAALQAHAAAMPPHLLLLAFALVLVGFGAKTGLAPMHTWLPDAHSQAHTPVCAVLSGVKTTIPLYVILRMLALVYGAPTLHLGGWTAGLGLASVALAAFLLLQVTDYKRMFAYSTIEHMGIILFAAGLATPGAELGAVWHLFNHAMTKSLCFYAAGALLLRVGTRDIRSVGQLWRTAPALAALLLTCSLAIAGAPPFPMFLSELRILEAGVRAGATAGVAILAILIVVAFVAILGQFHRMATGPAIAPAVSPLPLPRSCRWTLAGALAPIVVFGLYLPPPLAALLQLAARQLGVQ